MGSSPAWPSAPRSRRRERFCGTRRGCRRRGPGGGGCSSSRPWTRRARSCAPWRRRASTSSRRRVGDGSTRILPIRVPPSDDGAMSGLTSRYVLKPDPQSSHSIILRWLGEGRGRRLLDVGTADGILSQRLKERGWQVTGIEKDPALAQAGARHCEHMIVADLNHNIPAPGGPFDAIVYGDVIEHLVDPLAVLVGLNRALASDGLVFISVPTTAHLYVRLLLLVGRFDYTDRGILDNTHLRFFTEHSLRALIAGPG